MAVVGKKEMSKSSACRLIYSNLAIWARNVCSVMMK